MAKKKKKVTKFEDDPVSNAVCTEYGDIVESGDKVLNDLEELKVIGLSPALDLALGGGLREGSCVIMSGDPKTGKTVTSLHFAAKAQKLGKPVIYFNTEGRLVKENFTGIKGLNPAKMRIVQTSEAKPLVCAEEYLNSLEMYIKTEPEAVCIVDSVSNMLPRDEMEGEIRSGVRNNLPRLLSMFLKRVSGDVTRNKAIVIFILHNIANTAGGPFSPKKQADSGNMVQYQAGTNMVITHRGKWIKGEKDTGDHIGQIANWKIITSAAGGIPNSLAASWIRYGVGVDEAKEVRDIAIDMTLIKKAGAWFTITAATQDVKDKRVAKLLKDNDIDPTDEEKVERFFKLQGGDNLDDFLNKYPTIVDLLVEKVGEMF